MTNFEYIAKEAVSFFENLYMKDWYMRPIINNLFESQISHDLGLELEAPFREDEVKAAIFGMDGARLPGPNGFTMLFYQTCWDIIKSDLMMVFWEFYERSVMNTAMKSTFIVLILKKVGAKEVGDYRPISLIISLYKIISKLLLNQLQGVMGMLVSSTQKCFYSQKTNLGQYHYC